GVAIEAVLLERGTQARAAGGHGGEPLLLLRGRPAEQEGKAAQHHTGEERAGIGGAAHLLVDERQLDEAEPGAAVLPGERAARPAELGHLAPEGRAVRVERRAGGVLQQALVVAE